MRRILLLIWLLVLAAPVYTQDGLNLPTELYILRNEGQVERYGIGTVGVSTITPEDAFVLDFQVAPDGNWLAYRTLDGLFLTHIYLDDTSRQIEDSRAGLPDIRGRGQTMQWSPRSDALAYTTEYGARVHFFEDNSFSDIETEGLFNLLWSLDGRYLAAEAEGGVWWVYRVEAGHMLLTAALPATNGITWLSSTQILFAPQEGGLNVIDLSAGNAQTLLLDPTQRYYLPQRLPDNRVRVFIGEPNAAQLREIAFVDGQVTLVNSGVGAIDPNNVRWSPDGSLLTAFQGGVLALIDPASGGGFTLPISSASAFSWGPIYPQPATGQPLPASATFIAADANGIAQVWRLPQDGSRAVVLTSAPDPITDYALTLDEARIAYVSNSSLWVTALTENAEALEVTQLGISENVRPAWSPEGNVLYYRDDQNSEAGIYRADLSAQTTALFLPDTAETAYSNPVAANGVAALLVNCGDGLCVVDTTSAEVTPLSIDGVGRWQTGTQITALGRVMDGAGLYLFDANTPPQATALILPLLGTLEMLDYRVINDDTARVIVRATNPGELRLADVPLTGGTPTLVANAGYITDPHLAPDGSTVIGYTNPGGALIVYDVAENRSRLIDTLPTVSDFRWR